MIGLLLKGMLSIIPLAPEILVAYSIFAICFDKVRNLELEIYSSKSFFFSVPQMAWGTSLVFDLIYKFLLVL